MLPVLVTQPVAPTDGMVVTRLPVVSAKPVVPTLPVVQIHVPLLPGAAGIAAVARTSALAYLSACDGNGRSDNTGGFRCGIARSGGASLGGAFWAANGTPCCGSSSYSCNNTCCSGHGYLWGGPYAAVPYAAVVPSVAVLEPAVSP